ncbi:MAG: serine/threonine-protein kinase [Polyangiaceae bacterium]
MPTANLPAGTQIGSYRVLATLGAGGMGAVYRAQSAAGEIVALKVMLADPTNPNWEQIKRRFKREARATMALEHPNVVRILETFEHDNGQVIAMELLQGMSLREYLSKKGAIGVDEVAGIFSRVVSAVGAAHALGLVHRDLKPDNVFLLSDEPWVKILDFGVAKIRKGGALAETGALTKTGTMLGTPYYMAPEQAFGEKSIDHRADIWSLGMMLYEALTGTLLTRAKELEEVFSRLMTMKFPRLDEVRPGVPRSLADLVARMLERDPSDRPADLREVYAELNRHAPESPHEACSFEAAAAPLAFDDPSNPIAGAASPDSGPPRLAAKGTVIEQSAPTPNRPLKLAPHGIRVVAQRTPVEAPIDALGDTIARTLNATVGTPGTVVTGSVVTESSATKAKARGRSTLVVTIVFVVLVVGAALAALRYKLGG